MNLRKAVKSDIPACSKLIFLAARNIYRYSFGADEDRNHKIFEIMLGIPGGLYSLEYITAALKESRVQGALLAYPGSMIKELTKGMNQLFRPFLKNLGLLQMIKMARGSHLNRYYPEPDSDEFYIANLAVFPENRGQGVGLALLKEAERLAKKEGLPKLSLNVEMDNENGIRIYEKFGLKKASKTELPKKYRDSGILGFYHMIKEIV